MTDQFEILIDNIGNKTIRLQMKNDPRPSIQMQEKDSLTLYTHDRSKSITLTLTEIKLLQHIGVSNESS